MRITIVGGGIAGLTTALSLHAAGIRSEVRESARAIDAVGVGINLLPHAVRELTELGLGDELAGIALAPERLLYCDRKGGPVWEERLGRTGGYRWPQFSVHRGHLQMLLLTAVRRRIGPDAVRTGMAFQRFEEGGDGILVHFLNRADGSAAVEHTDVLIGADGIDSAVRAQLYPGQGPSNWNGVHMWRGVAEAPHILGGRTIVVAGGDPGDEFVAYPIADPPTSGGNAVLNWVLEVRHPGTADGLVRSNRRIGAPEARAGLDGWSLPWIDLASLVENSSDIYEYPMLDRDPLPRWSSGRVALLGDAAHPMFPMGMNGGSQSVVDARVLAWCLARDPDPAAALRRYDHLRRAPVNRIVLQNRALGPEKIIAEAAALHGELPAGEALEISRHYQQLSQATPGHLNSRPTWDVPRTGPQAAW
ncbi:FAD-dependent monooxygenase [Kitasatospora sp. NPDC091207]|uniref:FAD-dependent monooxygenase n=1 Tax=Kitasatospora sp. NPDC091207 TaxID=3364083 RepID=UPI00381C4179